MTTDSGDLNMYWKNTIVMHDGELRAVLGSPRDNYLSLSLGEAMDSMRVHVDDIKPFWLDCGYYNIGRTPVLLSVNAKSSRQWKKSFHRNLYAINIPNRAELPESTARKLGGHYLYNCRPIELFMRGGTQVNYAKANWYGCALSKDVAVTYHKYLKVHGLLYKDVLVGYVTREGIAMLYPKYICLLEVISEVITTEVLD